MRELRRDIVELPLDIETLVICANWLPKKNVMRRLLAKMARNLQYERSEDIDPETSVWTHGPQILKGGT